MNKIRSHFSLVALVLLLAVLFGLGAPTLAAEPGDVVINEIMQNPSAVADSAGEWFELYNATGADIDVNGWTIQDNDFDSHVIANGGPLVLPAGGYLVLGNNTDSGTNGGLTVDYSYGGSIAIANGADEIVLLDDAQTEIDRVEYDGGPTFPDPNGASMALIDPALDNNVGDNWCTASTPYGAGDLGTPGAANDCVSDPGELDDPLINEFVFNHSGTDTAEFIEVIGTPGGTYSAFTVLEIEGDGSGAGVVDGAYPVGTMSAGGFWTTGFLNNELENGTITLLLVESFSGATGDDLDTDNDGVLDSAPWARIVDDVAVSDGGSSDRAYSGTILSAFYDGAPFTPGGASRIPNGVDTDDVADWARNDFNGFGLPGFDATTPAEGLVANTPGFTNTVIPAYTPIYDIQFTSDPGGDSPVAGQTVTTIGVVTGAFSGGTQVFIQDGNGPWSGLFLFNPSTPLNQGELVLVQGEVTEFNGLTEIASGTVTVLSQVSPPSAEILATGDVAQEQWESVLVRVEDVTVTNEDLGFGEWSVSDSSGEVRVDDLGSYDYTPRNGDSLAYVQGPLHFSFGNFKIEPRNNGDIQLSLVCGRAATFIYDVQGSGASSPLNGQTVVVEGVVVGDFQNNGATDNGDLDGFHLQEEDADADGDPATSDGVFIYAPGSSTDVSNGDVVRVLGAVSEFNGMTEITANEIAVCGSGATVTPATVTLPVDSIDDLEAYEGMSVTFPQALVISEFFNFDRFGEIVLTTDRQFQPTAVYEPGSPDAAELADLNRRSRITLDDGRTSQNPDPAIHPNGMEFDLGNLFRGGDTVENVTGVLDYSFGLYRVQPTAGADYTSVNERPETPDAVGGDIQVASFNVLNYFTTLDQSGNLCGPPGFEQECRGADTAEELERQRAKIVAAIADIDAEVVGLIEIQNDEGASTEDLVLALNAFLGDDAYAYIDTGFIGTDAIKQAFIYQHQEVTPVGDFAVLDTPEFEDPNNTGEPKNRPALAQTFVDNGSGGVFTAVVNHLKSKGSECGPGDDDPEQGSCNLTRTLAAQILVDWLATDPTGSGDADFLIIGDLNAYDKEDPIDVLLANGYTDLVAQYGGEFAYSYVFDGQLGYLDHGLANSNLLPQVTGTTVWHINADEPDLIDYDTTFKQDAQDAIYEDNEYRSSDHDPVIVGLDLNGSPNCDAAAPSIASLWPPDHSFWAIDILDVTDPEGDPITISIDGIFQDEAVDADESGNTAPDGMGVGTSTAQIRAERVGEGELANGRVYHIFFTARDDQGGSCSGEVLVSVPVGRHMTAFDDGANYDSTVVPE